MNRRALARKAAGAKDVPEPPSNAADNSGVENVSRKLEEQLEKGDFYGALQMYKTLFMRYLKGEPNLDQQLKAIDLALAASLCLIKQSQLKAATEMATLMISVYTDFHLKVDEESKGRIRKINEAFLSQPEFGADLAVFLKSAVKWSTEEGSRRRGDPELQLLLARAYRSAGDYTHASKHYLHSENPTEFAKMLYIWSEEGYPSEIELYITRVVLQLLSLENLRDANKVYEEFVELCKKDNISVETPLIHFLKFLLLTLERDALPLFQVLQEKYGVPLSRDAAFKNYLSAIGQKFYGLQPPRTGLSSLLEMFSGGM